MTIRFICPCGKHLRAREGLAARRVVCPACGYSVGVPTSQATQARAPSGLLSRDEINHTWDSQVSPLPPVETPVPAISVSSLPVDPLPRILDAFERAKERLAQPTAPDQARAKPSIRRALLRARRYWTFETRWYHCLPYPFRAWPLVFGFALAFALVTVGVILVLPQLLALLPATGESGMPSWMWLAAALMMVTYACGFLDSVLASAAAGVVEPICKPDRNILLPLRSGLAWLGCFCAGPIVLAAAACWFWLHCGFPALVDWLILGELCVVAAGYWLLALVSYSRNEQLFDATPAGIVELVRRLGRRVLAVDLVAALLAFAHLVALPYLIDQLHRDPQTGIGLLFVFWASGMYWATFFFRLLGVWCHQTREEVLSAEC